jgi:putative DNA primase/helicase
MSRIDERAQREAERDLPRLVSLNEFVVRPAVSWLARDLLPAESIVVVFGAPKSGKTHVIADLTMHAAHGMHWHGHTVTRALRVAYLAGEGHNGLRVRLHAWRGHHAAELRGDMRLIPQALPLAWRLPDVLAVLQPYAPDVVVVDTLNAYFGGADENSTKDMTSFVVAVRYLRDELHSAVIVVHHTGLGDATRERGSSVLRAAADVIVQVARDDGGSGLVGMQVIEARDMEPWTEPLSLRLVHADTDWADDEGQPITTCIVAAGNAPVTLPGRGGRPLGEAQTTVLTIARELAATRRNGSADVLLARHEISALAQQRGVDRRRVSQSWESLARRGLIRLVEPGSIAMRAP